MKAQWSRRRDRATATALRYDTLLEAAREIEQIAELWQELAAEPFGHPAIRESRQETLSDPAPNESAEELDAGNVLLLMAQEPHRLWRAKEVQEAFALPSLTGVRRSLKAMVAAGQFEAVRRKARHLPFRMPSAPGPVWRGPEQQSGKRS